MNQENSGPSMMGAIEAVRFGTTLVGRCYAAFVHAFMRHRFGPKYFGLIEIGGLFVPILFAMTFVTVFPPKASFLPMLANVYLVLMIWHRIRGVSRSKKVLVHSRYNGYPRLCSIFPFREETAKTIVEPAFLILIGFSVVAFDPMLGAFLIIGGFVVGLDNDAVKFRTSQTVERIQDAEIDDFIFNQEVDRRNRRRNYES